MNIEKHIRLFDNISGFYGLFFKYQVKNYKKMINEFKKHLTIPDNGTVLDIGCGTGALSYALNQSGYNVIGLDASKKMIKKAKGLCKGLNIKFIVMDVLKGIKFSKKKFDLVISSFMVHGFTKDLRYKVFKEAKRVSKNIVIINDYNQEKNPLISFIEYLEGGDYFNFIKNAKNEMKDIFNKVKEVRIKKGNSWYICKI